MQFQVPQFIDIAPKIVGPLTLKQFLFIAGAAVPSFLLFFIVKFWLWIFISGVLASIALGFAFFKVNGQSLNKIVAAAFNYLWEPRFYLWRRIAAAPNLPSLPRLPHERPLQAPLKDLLLKLTTTRHPIEKRERQSKLFTLGELAKEGFESFRKSSGEREAARRIDYR